MVRSKVVETLPAFAGQLKTHIGLAILIGAGLRVAKIFTSYRGNTRNQIPRLFTRRSAGSAMSRQKNRIRRQNSALVLQSRLLARIWPTQNLLDLKHGGGLHNVFHPSGIVDSRQLHQNLVLAESMFLNRRFTHAQRVDAVPDRLDRLRNRLIFQVGQHLRLHGKRPDIVRAGTQVVFRQALGNDVQQVLARVR